MSLPVVQLGWIAGILDLRGRIVRKNNRKRRTPQLVITVETKEFPVIRRLASFTGTSPDLMEPRDTKEWMRRGCAEHCPDKHFHIGISDGPGPGVMPAIARWTITGAGAATVLHNVLPYLVSDRGFGMLYAEIIANTTFEGQGWAATRRSLERLEELGWDLPAAYEAALQRQREAEEDVLRRVRYALPSGGST